MPHNCLPKVSHHTPSHKFVICDDVEGLTRSCKHCVCVCVCIDIDIDIYIDIDIDR